ncbi:serine/threonine-protein kinase [Halocynthiibacter namhaensis]|uniref:serine/threonine-protein kinase n=1 Tax=Halocynthiibacter namhaensis TaxID=1290553 RepID=UPI00068FBDFA|nr:serine/threonine-protein kinase [Halocynthiibacter namhaensis]
MSQIQAPDLHDEDIPAHALLPGTSLLRGQYEIIRFLNSGGFGITYLARDSLERDVVIKECYPGALCSRDGFQVIANAPEYEADLASIITLFIQEARSHAKLVHPHIVPVHQVFEDNNTAYIAMDYIRGCDLLDLMDTPGHQFTPGTLIALTEKMLSAVSFIHEHGMLHRDISPDNILIDQHNEPVLIDFGAAREQAANRNAALVRLRVVKEGYSPQEFYVPGSVQGPYSDLYVLAATLYHVLVGEPPVDGQTRYDAYDKQVVDPYVPVTGRFDGYPAGFLEAIDKAMNVLPFQRQQSALEWLQMFRGPQAAFGATAVRPASVIAALGEADSTAVAAEDDGVTAAKRARIQSEIANAENVISAMMSQVASDVANENGSTPVNSAPRQMPDAGVAIDDTNDTPEMRHLKAMLEADDESDDLDLTEAEGEIDPADIAPFASLSPPEESPRSRGKMGVILGAVAACVLLAGLGLWGLSGSDTNVTPPPAIEPVTEIAAELDTQAEVVPEQTEIADAVPANEDVVVIEDASTETPLEATAGNVLNEQISFSHWDVETPFTLNTRRTSGGHFYIVNSVGSPDEMRIVGDWVQRGTAIYSVNSQAAQANVSLAGLMLRNLRVDDDGYTRASVRYKALGNNRILTGTIALPVVQTIGLANGLVVSEFATLNGQTEVTQGTGLPADQLRKGDVILREETTGVYLGRSGAFRLVLETLVQSGASEAKFVVNRNGAEVFAQMPLALE